MLKPIHTIECAQDGTVEQVYVQKNSYVYEWERLFLVKTEDGKLIDVSIGASGHITEINVTAGDPINRKLPLALLQDDFVITGSD